MYRTQMFNNAGGTTQRRSFGPFRKGDVIRRIKFFMQSTGMDARNNIAFGMFKTDPMSVDTDASFSAGISEIIKSSGFTVSTPPIAAVCVFPASQQEFVLNQVVDESPFLGVMMAAPAAALAISITVESDLLDTV